MKRLLLLATLSFAFYASACGGGGGTPAPPPPPTGGFSNASLQGTYAFSMTGEDLSGSPISRVGSFVADGSGNISAAMEDVTDAGSTSQAVPFTSGTYTIQSNGKGTLTLNSTLSGIQFSIALESTTTGLMIQTDLNATSSGSFMLQSASAFTQTAINGSYAFDVTGIDTSGNPLSILGQIAANGGGAVTGGVLDLNDGGASAPSGASAIPAGGTYALDPTNGATFGRGVITFAGFQFSFYIVDGTHLKMLETDAVNGFTSGDSLQQSGTIPTTTAAWPAGSFVFEIGGGSVLGTAGPVVRASRFTTNGSGTVSAIALDDNADGTVKSIGSGSSVSYTTYAIDTTAGVVGSGRGTVTFTDSNLGTFSFVFYLVSPTQAFIQDISAGIIGDGTLLAQTGSLSASSLAGNYAFNWSGVNLGSSQNAPFEVDSLGQYTSTSSGSISGAVDLVELGSTTKSVPADLGIALSGNLAISGDGTASNTYTATVQASPSNTFNYKAYIVSPNFIFLVGSDTDRVIAGSVAVQTVPQ